jgi:MinD-like ATPase involved in chromosome partitioning or flagellar assembly
VLSAQEGVGQTTVTALLGLALAQHRAGRVIAVDADPRHGTLADRSPGTATFTARQVARERFMADAFARLPADAAHPPLHILAAVAVADAGMGTGAAPNHGTLADQLARYYSIVLTDPGSAMVQAALRGTLDAADAVVLVSGTGADEARRASEMLSWLEAHGRADLAGRAIVVLNQSAAAHPEESAAHPEEAEAHFADRVPHVIRLPHDPHLAHGSRIELARLSPATRAAVLELAALLTAELKD